MKCYTTSVMLFEDRLMVNHLGRLCYTGMDYEAKEKKDGITHNEDQVVARFPRRDGYSKSIDSPAHGTELFCV